jgi:predicted XRE-type DNA-binding protein
MRSQRIKGSIFDEPSLFDPIEGQVLKTKAQMLHQLEDYITERKMNVQAVMQAFGIDAQTAQKLIKPRITAFTIDELAPFLDKIAVHGALRYEVLA